MERMIVAVEWEGSGPRGPQEIKNILDSHYKNRLTIRRLNVETNKPEKLAYTAGEVASLLGISSATVYSLIYQKQIPAIHLGKRWIIPKAALENQLGGSVLQKGREFISEVDRADILAATDEALKLYDLLRGKLTLLMKNL